MSELSLLPDDESMLLILLLTLPSWGEPVRSQKLRRYQYPAEATTVHRCEGKIGMRTSRMLTFSRSRLALSRVNPNRFRRLARLARLPIQLALLSSDDVRRDARTFADGVAVLVLEAEEASNGRAARVGPFCGREGRQLSVYRVEGGVQEVRDRSRRVFSHVLEEVLFCFVSSRRRAIQISSPRSQICALVGTSTGICCVPRGSAIRNTRQPSCRRGHQRRQSNPVLAILQNRR